MKPEPEIEAEVVNYSYFLFLSCSCHSHSHALLIVRLFFLWFPSLKGNLGIFNLTGCTRLNKGQIRLRKSESRTRHALLTPPLSTTVKRGTAMRWLHQPQHQNSTCTPILGLFGGSVSVCLWRIDRCTEMQRKRSSRGANVRVMPQKRAFFPSAVSTVRPKINLFVFLNKLSLTPVGNVT